MLMTCGVVAIVCMYVCVCVCVCMCAWTARYYARELLCECAVCYVHVNVLKKTY